MEFEAYIARRWNERVVGWVFGHDLLGHYGVQTPDSVILTLNRTRHFFSKFDVDELHIPTSLLALRFLSDRQCQGKNLKPYF